MRCHRKGIFLSTHSLTGLSTLDHYAWPPWQIWFTATYPQDPLHNVLGGLIAQYTITQYDNCIIYYNSSLLDLTDGKYFVTMEWSMILERHPLDLMEWRCFYGLMITKQLLVPMEWQWFLERQPLVSMVANHWSNDQLVRSILVWFFRVSSKGKHHKFVLWSLWRMFMFKMTLSQ